METTKSRTSIDLSKLSLIIGARAMVGVGIALLLADRFTREQRKAMGKTLFFIGSIISIPLALQLIEDRQIPEEGESSTRLREAA